MFTIRLVWQSIAKLYDIASLASPPPAFNKNIGLRGSTIYLFQLALFTVFLFARRLDGNAHVCLSDTVKTFPGKGQKNKKKTRCCSDGRCKGPYLFVFYAFTRRTEDARCNAIKTIDRYWNSNGTPNGIAFGAHFGSVGRINVNWPDQFESFAELKTNFKKQKNGRPFSAPVSRHIRSGSGPSPIFNAPTRRHRPDPVRARTEIGRWRYVFRRRWPRNGFGSRTCVNTTTTIISYFRVLGHAVGYMRERKCI